MDSDFSTGRFDGEGDVWVRSLVTRQEMDDYYQKHYSVTPEIIDIVRKLPQGSREWLDGIYVDAEGKTKVPAGTPGGRFVTTRGKRLTASVAAGYASCSTYKTLEKVALQFFWPSFEGNDHTRYGTQHEPQALDLVLYAMREMAPYSDIYVEGEGLVIDARNPWLALSSDGTWWLDGKLSFSNEIKSPGRKKFYEVTPSDHYAQMMVSCFVQQLPSSLYVVFTPERLYVREYPFDPELFARKIFLPLQETFFKFILPRLVLLEKSPDSIRPGELYPRRPDSCGVPRPLAGIIEVRQQQGTIDDPLIADISSCTRVTVTLDDLEFDNWKTAHLIDLLAGPYPSTSTSTITTPYHHKTLFLGDK